MVSYEKEKQRLIHNLEAEIYNYENGYSKPIKSNRQKMSDIWARYRYEVCKIQLKAFGMHDDAFMRIQQIPRAFEYYDSTKIRTLVTAMASKGRTLKVTELTDYELAEARLMANKIVNEYIEKYRAAIL